MGPGEGKMGVWINKCMAGTKDSAKVTPVAQPEKRRNSLLVIAFVL